VVFPTVAFAYFFLVVFTLAWALRGHRVVRNGLLLLASYAFYATWELRFAGWLLILSVVDWGVGEALLRTSAPRARHALLVLGVLANAGLLATLKLYDFFRESLARLALLLGLEIHLPLLELIAPVGLSFYAFQGLAYVVDVYRGKAYRPDSGLDFLLFMAFFPKLLAGPICRSHELLPQLARPAPATIPDLARCVALVASGLLKKMVLAAYLSTHMVGAAFEMPEQQSWPALVVALYAYTAEIYLDFSGYTDLARGLALLLGFELPENFRHPYAAASISEFWRRWHMTFSSWLRDYVYFPLGGSRHGRARTYANLMATMAVCGLWHGASWGFVIWGLLHGLALVAHKIWRDWRGPGSGVQPGGLAFAAGCFATVTFCAVVRIFFRSEDLATAGAYFAALLRPRLDLTGVDPLVVAITVLCLLMNLRGPAMVERFERLYRLVPRPLQPVAWVGFGVVLLALETHEVTPYIYFGF
jgi:D-alanyl-lipoteichoic acid acyltransferase DltB (MBOAT superfamily)